MLDRISVNNRAFTPSGAFVDKIPVFPKVLPFNHPVEALRPLGSFKPVQVLPPKKFNFLTPGFGTNPTLDSPGFVWKTIFLP